MKPKLLSAKYKTFDGAQKRAGFENGMARFEYQNGYKARLYRYATVADPSGDGWRVERRIAADLNNPVGA